MNESVIRTDGLTKRYGDILAVDDLTLEVPGGQVFGLLGPNGSGKTTTMGMLLGLVRPTMGSFSLFGGSTSHQNALHRVGAIVETPLSTRTCRAATTSPTTRASPAGATGKSWTTC